MLLQTASQIFHITVVGCCFFLKRGQYYSLRMFGLETEDPNHSCFFQWFIEWVASEVPGPRPGILLRLWRAFAPEKVAVRGG